MMTKTLEELFDIGFNISAFERTSSHVVSDSIQRSVNSMIEKNEEITRMLSEKYAAINIPDQVGMDALKRKFRQLKRGELLLGVEGFSKNEVRKISYFPNQIVEDKFNDYDLIIKILDANWHWSYLNGLVFCLLNNWQEYEYKIETRKYHDYVINRLLQYQGSRRLFVTMKQNVGYLKDGGPVALGQDLLNQKKSIFEAVSVLGLNKHDFLYFYFSKVLRAYYRSNILSTKEFEEVLQLHNNKDTNKIIISEKICKVNVAGNDRYVDLMKRYAIKFIGDPFVFSYWNTIGLPLESVETVKNAHLILRKWLIKRCIDLAFTELVDDPDRKSFWLRYVDYISDIKIVGSYRHQSIIHSHPDLAEIRNCFKRTTAERNNSTCAIVIMIKDYMFVEYSELGRGACYVYHDNHDIKGFYNWVLDAINSGVRKVDDLKITDLNSLIDVDGYYLYFHSYGRMIHSGYWQNRFDRWFNDKLGIYV